MKARVAAEYLNVDLEVRSRSTLTPLVDALSRRLHVLHVGRLGRDHFASFEVIGGSGAPESAVRRFVRVVDALPAAAARHWKQAHDRVFDVGVATSPGASALSLPLSLETVKAIARLRARVSLTVYRGEHERARDARRRVAK
jgi:hypothetical protein